MFYFSNIYKIHHMVRFKWNFVKSKIDDLPIEFLYEIDVL